MRPHQSVEIQLLDGNGKPLSLGNILLEVHFFTNGNFRYSFKVGRTNNNGQLCFSYADVEALRRQYGTENLMDYNTPLEDCDPAIKLVAPSQQQLCEQQESALKFYNRSPEWSKDWPGNSSERAEAVFALSGEQNQVEIEIDAPA